MLGCLMKAAKYEAEILSLARNYSAILLANTRETVLLFAQAERYISSS